VKYNLLILEKVNINETIIILVFLYGFIGVIFKLGFDSKFIFNFSGKYNHINEFPIIIFAIILPIIVDIPFNF
jgi:hypothetical protein